MKKIFILSFCLICCAALSAQSVQKRILGGLRLSQLYTDNMVLQHGCPLTIHGVANAGDKVTVSIASQRYTTNPLSNGQWSIRLQPLKVGRPLYIDSCYREQKLQL